MYVPWRIEDGGRYGYGGWGSFGLLVHDLSNPRKPLLVGRSFILELMPFWVAALTHVVYGLTLGLLQPLGRFVPYRPVTT